MREHPTRATLSAFAHLSLYLSNKYYSRRSDTSCPRIKGKSVADACCAFINGSPEEFLNDPNTSSNCPSKSHRNVIVNCHRVLNES